MYVKPHLEAEMSVMERVPFTFGWGGLFVKETPHLSLDTGGHLRPGKHTWLHKDDSYRMQLETWCAPEAIQTSSSTGVAVRKVPVKAYLIYYCFQFSCLPLCSMICHQLRETLRRFLYVIIYPNALFIEFFFFFGWRLPHQHKLTVFFFFISLAYKQKFTIKKKIILLWKAVHI